MAALTGTGGNAPGMISFTQQNEQEADRIGIQVLQRSIRSAGDADLPRKITRSGALLFAPAKILLTHPLPESRRLMPVTVPIRCAR